MSKPIRTILCVPAHDLHKVERARDFGADLILWDLEDSVPASQKERARELVAAHARPGDAVRLSKTAPIAADFDLIFGLPGVTPWLPKVTSLSVSCGYADALGCRVVPIIEDPLALATLATIGSGDGLTDGAFAALAFGRADFMAAVGARGSGWPLVDRAQEMVALAAHALGVPCYDSPCESRDPRDARAAAGRAVACCYTGIGCVYPEHIPIVREIFQPEERELERAARIVAGAEERGGELFEDDGAVVAPPHVKAARELLLAAGR